MENSNESNESIEKVEHADFETAIMHTGFGRFQWLLLCACGGVYATCAISTTTLSFVLPAAECDFLLTSADMGRLSATPLIGMVFGSYFWGSLADTRGRKWVIIFALLMDALAAVLSSTVQSFEWFLVFRFFSGFGIIGATSIIFSYLGEFMSIINRDAMLSRLEVFWNFGIILLPGLAWIVIPQQWHVVVPAWSGQLTLTSWRVFVALCSVPSLLSAAALVMLPESPRFLISNGNHKKARQVLQQVYRMNTGKEGYEYPVTHLHGEIFCLQNGSVKKTFIPWRRRLRFQAEEIWLRNKEIFSFPHLKHLLLTCFADFGLMSSYYTLMMWFPELFERFDMYQWHHPGVPAGICDVTSVTTPEQDFGMNNIQNCTRTIDHKVFLYTIIIGVSCLPTSLSLGFLIDKMGKKYLIMCSLVASGASVIGLNWVHSTLDTLALSCLFEALTSTAEAVIFCIVVDLFPTNLRAIALALTVTSGRLGAILGNVIFGWLVDLNCAVPIYTFGLLLIYTRDPYEPADFESAISATGFGKFNYLLLLTAIAASFSSSFATTTISYILPVAQCDLNLSLFDKGMLNACTYMGMISSAFLWGFLADTMGRKKLQVWGYWLDTLCNIGCAASQSFWMLLVFKYCSGFLVTGPYSILMSYLSEFHCTRYRSRVIVLAGVFLSAGNVTLPFLAWSIIPVDMTYTFFGGAFQITSWRVFLLIAALPSFFAAIGHTALPESPKFLMTIGRNEEALEVFQKVYEMNTGNPRDQYPVRVLVEEKKEYDPSIHGKIVGDLPDKKTAFQQFCDGMKQMKGMIMPPYLMNFILINGIQFAGMMGVNTLRLWLPQLFTTIEEYNKAHSYATDASLCDMLAQKSGIENSTLEEEAFTECTVNYIDDEVYINSIIVASWSCVGFFFVGTLINAMGKKNLLIISFAISGVTGIANYWSRSSLATLALSSSFVTFAGICNQVIIGVIVELFPTTLRTMVVSISFMMGRIGATLGNMTFPLLLSAGCMPPFLFVGGVTFFCAFLCLFLPSKSADFK